MAITQFDTENAVRDLTSQVICLTHTPNKYNDVLCIGHIKLGDGVDDLDESGGLFELTISVGGQIIEPDPQTVHFSTASRVAIWTSPFSVPAGEEVLLKIKSPNGADTDVGVTAYLFESGESLESKPHIVGSLYNQYFTDSGWLDIVDEIVYMPAIGGDSFTTIDVKDPTNPTLMDQIVDGTNLNGAEYSEVIEGYAYVTAIYSNAFHSIDVSDPESISITDSITNTDIGGSALSGPAGVAIVDNVWGRDRVAFVANYNGRCMTALDISDPTAMTHIVTTAVDVTNNNQMINVVRVGSYLFTVSRLSKMLNVWNIATTDTITSAYNLTDPTLLRFERLGGMCEANGNYLYLPCSTNYSVSVVDISTPTTPVIVGHVRDTKLLGGDTRGAYVPALVDSENILCTVRDGGDGGLGNRVVHINVADPTNPYIVDYISSNVFLEGPDDVQCKNGLAYVTCCAGKTLTIVKFPSLL